MGEPHPDPLAGVQVLVPPDRFVGGTRRSACAAHQLDDRCGVEDRVDAVPAAAQITCPLQHLQLPGCAGNSDGARSKNAGAAVQQVVTRLAPARR